MVILISRRVATIGLFLFAAGGITVGVLAVSRILQTLSAFAACTTPLEVSTHDHLLSGAFALALFPLWALFRSERIHKLILIAFVVTVIGLPIGAFRVVDGAMDDHGYVVTAGTWSMLARDVAELDAVACVPATTAAGA